MYKQLSTESIYSSLNIRKQLSTEPIYIFIFGVFTIILTLLVNYFTMYEVINTIVMGLVIFFPFSLFFLLLSLVLSVPLIIVFFYSVSQLITTQFQRFYILFGKSSLSYSRKQRDIMFFCLFFIIVSGSIITGSSNYSLQIYKNFVQDCKSSFGRSQNDYSQCLSNKIDQNTVTKLFKNIEPEFKNDTKAVIISDILATLVLIVMSISTLPVEKNLA
jgi:hypothetical protein